MEQLRTTHKFIVWWIDNKLTWKQGCGCLAFLLGGCFLVLVASGGNSDLSDCYGSLGESLFRDAVKHRLANPDSFNAHDIRTQYLEDQRRHAVVLIYSGENAFGARRRQTAVGYLEETEGSRHCKVVVLSMNAA